MRISLVLLGLLLAAPAVAASEPAPISAHVIGNIIVATPVSGTSVTSGTSHGCDGYPVGTIRMNANGAAQLCRP